MRHAIAAFIVLLAVPPVLESQDSAPIRPKVTKRAADRITLEEIQALPDARDAYELVRQLRPAFLIVRATGSAGQSRPGILTVWVNGAERGPVETLRTIPAHAVMEIRKISATDAMTRYGKEQNGVILVTVSATATEREP